MASKPVQDAATEEIKMDLTPMIDVTFQLIIFFMCAIKFKVLEGKLQTFLPKDVGVNASPINNLLQKVDVRIDRVATREQLGLENTEKFRAWKEKPWDFNELKLSVMGQPIKSLKQLEDVLRQLRKDNPAPTDVDGPDNVLGTPDDEDDPLKMNIEAMVGVLYDDVVRIVDVAIASGFTSITFRGIQMDA